MIILTFHWQIDVENFFISKEDPYYLINSQASEHSFGTCESFYMIFLWRQAGLKLTRVKTLTTGDRVWRFDGSKLH